MRSAETTRPKITLGALYRSLLDRLDTSLGLRVVIHFEERTSIVVEPAVPGTEPTRIEQRTFDADLAVRGGQVMRATLTAGATGAESLVIRVAQSDGTTRYSIAGAGFGDLRVTPDLFDLGAFGERLDGVRVDDAVIAPEAADGSGRIVIDAEIGGDAFSRLLRAFGGGETGSLELPLLSHSAVLSAGSDVTLDYWWSLLGLDEVEGRPARHNVVICHVHASFAPLTGVDELGGTIDADPGLPVLEDIDAAWELARQRGVGA
jgi:hypothetical protein